MDNDSEIYVQYVGGGQYHVSLVKHEPTTKSRNVVFLSEFSSREKAMMFVDDVRVIVNLRINDTDS